MIKLYPNRMLLDEPELHEVASTQTLLEYFWSKGLSRDKDICSLPTTVWHDGVQVLPTAWHEYVVNPDDDICMFREPEGTDPFSITFALIFAGKAVLSALMPKIPGIPNSKSGSGDALDEASAKGNKVKINDLIPECAGFNRRYGDYGVPPRRYFTAPRAQWIDMLLIAGVGQYKIDVGTIKVGETPTLSLGSDAEVRIYQPGADLSADPAHQFWYSAPEVGQGSTGAAGLELTVSSALTLSATASVFQYNSNTLSIPAGAGSFPSDWTSGLLLAVADPYVYSVADGTGTGGRDIISGGNVANLGFTVGETIEIQGDNQALYEVFSITATELQLNYVGGAPAVGLATGNRTMAIGYVGLRYRITGYSAQSLLLERIKSSGATDTGWPGWVSNSSNAGRVQLDSSNLQGGYRGPFQACPPAALSTAIEWEVFFPSGLVYLRQDGSYGNLTAQHTIEWRDSALQGAWNVSTYSHTNNVLNALGYTHRIDLPYPMRPEVRMKKTLIGGIAGNDFVDTTMWTGLKAFIPAASPTRYDGVTVITMRIRGGDRISSQTESLANWEQTRILPVLNGAGAWGPAVPTRQISAWIGYIARSVGYSDDDLNMAELQRLENTWTARGDYYDKIITSAGTVKEYMIEALQAGFAELTLDRGVITPVRDEPRQVMQHIYDPMNMTKPLNRKAAYVTPDDFDGVDVEYFDRTTWANETVQCRWYFNGVREAGTRIDKMKLEGVTDRNRAYRIGMRRRGAQIFRDRSYTFNTELDALNSEYLDYAGLGDQVIGYGESAYMTSFQAVADRYYIGTSETFDWSAGGVFKMSIRRKDGSIAGPYTVARVSDRVVSILKQDFDTDLRTFTPDLSGVMEPPFLRFGPEPRWIYPALITEVAPSGTQGCKVTAVNYDVRVYQYDNAFADN
jgi:hypothetical protein